MEIQVTLQYEVGIVDNLTHQAEILLLQGQITEARSLATRALARTTQRERRYERAWLYLNLATIDLLLEAYQKALEPLEKAQAMFESMKVRHGTIITLQALTCALTHLGTLSQAAQYEMQAQGLSEALGYHNVPVQTFEQLFSRVRQKTDTG